MDNLCMPLGGHSYKTMIILSYKPLVPNRSWTYETPSALFKSIPPAYKGRTTLFVFQTHILRHLDWEKVTEGRINYVFLSYFTRNYTLK